MLLLGAVRKNKYLTVLQEGKLNLDTIWYSLQWIIDINPGCTSFFTFENFHNTRFLAFLQKPQSE